MTNRIFTKEEVNTGRQKEFDLLKAFIVTTLLILAHTYMFCTDHFQGTLVHGVYDILSGVFSAPLFIFCMGVVLSYSKHNSPSQIGTRGVKILTVGLLLNLTRIFIPVMFNIAVTGSYGAIEHLWLFFAADIMEFAGLAMMLMAVLKKCKLRSTAIFAVSIVMSIIGTALAGNVTGCKPIDTLLGYFWWTNDASCFPLLTWFIFYAFGLCVGRNYVHICDKNRFYRIAAPIGLALIAAYIYITMYTGQTILVANSGDETGYYMMRTLDALAVVAGVIPGTVSLFWLFSKLIPDKAMVILGHPSRHINRYYCVSWTIICLIPLVFMLPPATGDLGYLGYSLLVEILTILVVTIYTKYLEIGVEAFISKRFFLWAGLVWIITAAVWIWYFNSPLTVPYL